MTKVSRGKTIYLPQDMGKEISDLVKKFRSYDCRINESNLVTEIVIDHLAKRDTKFSEKVKEKYFDQKKFLRNLLSSGASEADIIKALKKIKNRKPVRAGTNHE